MRDVLMILGAAALLCGCNPGDFPGYGTATEQAAEPDLASRLDQWEQRWAAAKRELSGARAGAAATGRPVAPDVEQAANEVLSRDLTGPDDPERLRRLQESVADALRLAELVSFG